jgi:parallel beta-helix repeat protein
MRSVGSAIRVRGALMPRLRSAAIAVLVLLLAATGGALQAASLRLAPQSVTLVPGATYQFTVSGSRGKISWSATGGTITSTGLYKAAAVPGSFIVRVADRSSSVTAAVTITAPAPPVTVYPGGLVPIYPGESIQAAVDTHAAGTGFLIKRGVHRQQSIRPKEGMSFIGESGAVLDGENVAPYAFQAHLVNSVAIRGLRVTRYAPPNLTAAVDAVETRGWLIEDNEIDHNSNGLLRTYGLRLGSWSAVRGNKIHHNGWLGISCYNETDTVVENNELYANPAALVEDTIGEAANLKMFDCGRITIRGNNIHDGRFRGIWVDTMQPDITIEHNRVINHGAQGIWYELSYRGVIRNNYVENAGFLGSATPDWPTNAGIQVTNSPDVSVLDNTVVNSLNGIIGHQVAGYPNGRHGASELRNLLVQGNTMVMPHGQTGIAQNVGSNDVFLAWNNRFQGNHYQLNTNATPFFWIGLALDDVQWQGYGQDLVAAGATYTRTTVVTPPVPPAMTYPSGLVPVYPGESIQAAVDAHAIGTGFLIKSGVHRRQSVRPKEGMSFIGESGAVLDGENVAPYAFQAHLTNSVTIRGLRVTRYAPPQLNAAVDASETMGWILEDNEIDSNSNGLLRVYGVRLGSWSIVRRNKIHHNGWVGISGYKAIETLIEGNEVYANPATGITDTVGEAANIKLYGCGRITIRDNYVHDGAFRGIWLDRSQPDMTIESNRVINHGQQGIWYEVSYRGIIRNNYVDNAGYDSYYSSGWLRGGAISVTNSPDVFVIGNTVVNSLNGIIGLQAAGYYDGLYGKNELRNLLVQGNTIVMQRGQTGIAENIGSSAVFLSWNNRFEGNQYHLHTIPKPFHWMSQSLDEVEWQAFGQDTPASSASFARP